MFVVIVRRLRRAFVETLARSTFNVNECFNWFIYKNPNISVAGTTQRQVYLHAGQAGDWSGKFRKIKKIYNRKKTTRSFTFFWNQHLEQPFPDVSIALRIYSCMAVTNCSAERSFSCLKRIKTYLRSSVGENRLSSLALLCIESELVSAIDFQDITDEFSNLESQKKLF